MGFSTSWWKESGGEHYLGDFPPWQPVYTYFRNWGQDGTWLHIHDGLRQWTRIEIERHRSPSEAIIDSQSVKSSAMVTQEVGFDAGKKIKGRKQLMILFAFSSHKTR